MQATLILYESPKRIQQLLGDLVQFLGGERQAAVCRELTKRFEEVSRGTLADLAAAYADREVKGEIVVVIDRAAVRAADYVAAWRRLETLRGIWSLAVACYDAVILPTSAILPPDAQRLLDDPAYFASENLLAMVSAA